MRIYFSVIYYQIGGLVVSLLRALGGLTKTMTVTMTATMTVT